MSLAFTGPSDPGPRTLLLLRHAEAAPSGGRDRPLTPYGVEQAVRVGAALRSAGLVPDVVLCSPAVRTVRTLEALGLGGELLPGGERVDLSAEVYEAGSDTLAELVSSLPAAARCALLVGHGPGIPSLARDLAGPGSDPAAVTTVETRFPTATLARVELDGSWAELDRARLVALDLG